MLYRVWLNEADEWPEEGLGWRVVFESTDERLANIACEAFNYSYIEEVPQCSTISTPS